MTMAHATLGTLLRALIEQLDSAVAGAYADAGLDYKPRYTPIIRALAKRGPMRMKDIAVGIGVSHSAVSQSIGALVRGQWVELRPGADSRERIVHLTATARARLPLLRRHWAATAMAAASLDDDLGLCLEEVLRNALQALQARPFEARIREARTPRKTAPARPAAARPGGRRPG
ncbi:MarR family winged helix-turn-helix transcriptional regulator [Stenotrophomonas mori]|uniref:MarR family transcriptional regulator n=1 Tax=Stenotrophomonas mori TaxID=2871096 RepID=A0ABT0SIT3_9GAMM|nr:MarR family transcriptional regulator [Stenotrophomonas mori]MCL7715247.1 MarR family transcriptional regulator [Stenotrophomonas mori]